MIFLQIPATPETILHFGGLDTFSTDFLVRIALDVLAVGLLIRLVYYRIYRRSDLFLTFFGFNFVIFLITYLLNQVQMSIGAAFGLFAVFSMLRYRTQGISAKDMTYLFMVISIGLISAISQGGWFALVCINGLILISVQLLEGNYFFKRELSKAINYDRIDHIRPEKLPILLAELQLRTGLPVHRVDMQSIDFVKGSVQLVMYYYANQTIHAPSSSPKSKIQQTITAE
ncbi:DUF4956 domain-containing protein [Spirosoma sp. BT702]|uniref:DUF4956 domain-containing protein n=1 Tax=Spirosoma profusum TaxID=2771354 RepID=A0A926Y4E5_9BACT|nr:DUF4956 domain-containing protein [Spirosoma profusum]MBD2703041.1 DUF4956 domain-containing protein [Spirosoma profusum]